MCLLTASPGNHRAQGPVPFLSDKARHQVEPRIAVEAHVLEILLGIAHPETRSENGPAGLIVERRGEPWRIEAERRGVDSHQLSLRHLADGPGGVHHLYSHTDPASGRADIGPTCRCPLLIAGAQK